MYLVNEIQQKKINTNPAKWAKVLSLAMMFGWQPMGVKRVIVKDGQEVYSDYPSLDYKTMQSFCKKEGISMEEIPQVLWGYLMPGLSIEREDADNLSKALSSAIESIPYEDKEFNFPEFAIGVGMTPGMCIDLMHKMDNVIPKETETVNILEEFSRDRGKLKVIAFLLKDGIVIN